MSKRNMLLGTAAGKVGDLVFYRAGGEQRTRTKVTPSNPKTYAQQAQRSRMANVTLMYRALSALLKDTFPTRPSKQTAFNAFSAEALPVAPYLTKENADLGRFILAPALIAKGSVPVPFSEVFATSIGGSNEGRVIMEFASESNPTTVGQLAAALMAWRPCCFVAGGSLVLVTLADKNDLNPGNHVANYIKIPMDVTDTTTLASLDVTVTTVQKEGDVDARTTIAHGIGEEYFAFGAIIERPKEGGGYDVSDARLALGQQAQLNYDRAIDDGAKLEAAISYGGTQGSCVI